MKLIYDSKKTFYFTYKEGFIILTIKKGVEISNLACYHKYKIKVEYLLQWIYFYNLKLTESKLLPIHIN